MFDLTKVVAKKSFENIPAGTYMARVREAELKDTKEGSGKYIQCSIEIVGGEHDSRRLWSRFNVVNKNPQAVEIGMQELKSMMLASGLPEEKCVIKNVTDLEGMSFGVKVIIKDDRNEVKSFLAMAPSAFKADAAKTTDKTDNPFKGW